MTQWLVKIYDLKFDLNFFSLIIKIFQIMMYLPLTQLTPFVYTFLYFVRGHRIKSKPEVRILEPNSTINISNIFRSLIVTKVDL